MSNYYRKSIDEAIYLLENKEMYEQCGNLLKLKNAIKERNIESYIKLCFDVKGLTKAGFLKPKMSFAEIEERIKIFFGYKEIFEYSLNENCSFFCVLMNER